MKTLESCCGCCSLKTGALIIAILTVISATLSLIGTVVQLAVPSSSQNEKANSRQSPNNINAYYTIGPTIIYFGIALCFLYGVIKEKKHFILPILIVNMIYAVALSVYTVIFAVAVHPAFLVAFAVVVLVLYLWYVTLSFYKSL